MEYKLLRALSIILQAGLVILLAMLFSLLFLSWKPSAKHSTAQTRQELDTQKGIMEQRFWNEIQKSRPSLKTFCLKQQAVRTTNAI
jgi:hypothetical protein